MKNTAPTNPVRDVRGGIDRRALLTGGALGAALGIGASLASPAVRAQALAGAPATDTELFGEEKVSCHGAHQAGIATTPGAHARWVAYTLRPDTDRAALERMFRILTDDIEGLTAGDAPLADSEPELADEPSSLTITVGVGAGLVNRVAPGLCPAWLAPLPAFSRDELAAEFTGGDLLLYLQADDPLPLAHAARMLHRDLASFVTQAWSQQGFRGARGAAPTGTTMRNLMGQVDGTVNPKPGTADFDSLVWLEDGWLAGGTAFVLRRIRLELDTWEQVDRPGREQTIGRDLATGAPLTGGTEHSDVDFDAKNKNGLPVIPSYAHIRRAHSTDSSERIFRSSANYDTGSESGLLFGCYQRDPLQQFVPIQSRLDELDLLNEWVTHTGSAVFAMLPGFRRGERLGDSLFS